MTKKRINLNDFTRDLAQEEGKKVQTDIGQIKEICSIVFRKLAAMPPADVEDILQRYR